MQCGFRSACFYVYVLPVAPQVLHASMNAYRATSNGVRRSFLLLRNYAFYFLLLILCDDIEVNPGLQVQLKELLDKPQHLMAKLIHTEANQASADSRLSILSIKKIVVHNLQRYKLCHPG